MKYKKTLIHLTILFSLGLSIKPVFAENVEVSNFSEIQNAINNYVTGTNIIFTGNIADVAATLIGPSGIQITIDAQGYSYLPNATGFQAFDQSGSGSGRPISIMNMGTSANPVTGWYNSTSNLGSFVRSGNSLAIANSYFSGNGVSGTNIIPNAGVIYSETNNVIHILDSTFANNQAVAKGGAIYSKATVGNVTINNSIFDGNKVSQATGDTSYGGAVRIEATNLTSPQIELYIKDSTFSSNTSEVTSGSGNAFGGAISTVNAVGITIQNTIFDGNTVSVATSGNRAHGGALTVSNIATIINSSFTNNQAIAVNNNAFGGAISYNGSNLTLIANGSDFIFDNNTANGSLNDIYIYGRQTGPLNLNVSDGNKIEFNGTIKTGDSVQTININQAGLYNHLFVATDVTHRTIANNSLAPTTTNLPTLGKVIINNLVENSNINLFDGILELNGTGNSADISTCNLNLYGGIFDISNNQLVNVSVNSLISTIAAKLNFDVNMATGASDSISVTNSIAPGSYLTLNAINIIDDGNFPSITLFEGGNSPILSGAKAYTNTFEYTFIPSNTTNGVLDVVQVPISANALKAAVDDTTLNRNFSMIEDEIVTVNLGNLAGGSGASLNIFGNTYSIDGRNNNGITATSGQALSINNVGNYQNFLGISGGAVQNAGTLTITGTNFSNNTASSSGGAVSNSGATTIAETNFASNTALNGGAVINTGTMDINGNTTFTDNTATADGGAIYNTGTLNLNSSEANIIFSANQANGVGNDIYNTGTVNVNGTANDVNLTGGFSGTGIINKQNVGTLTISGDSDNYTGVFNQNEGQTTISGALFNGQSNINIGNLTLATGSSMSSNSSINLLFGANLYITKTDDLTFNNASLLGQGSILKTGSGILNLSGDNSAFSGIYTQTAGSTVVSGNLFNNILNISNSDIELATGSSFSQNSVINLGVGSSLDISKTDNLTLTSGMITGTGPVNKTGSGTLILSGNNSAYTGDFTQTAGTTTVSELSTIFGGNNNINGGILEISSDTINYNVNLGSTSTTTGTLNNIATSNSEIAISNNNINFTGTGAVANFSKESGLIGNANYILNTTIDNSQTNTVNFENSNVKLGLDDYSGATIYSFNNSVLDLTSDNITTTTFDNLVINNSSLNFDISFNGGTSLTSDILNVTNPNPQVIGVNTIRVLDDTDTGLSGQYSVKVLGGNIDFTGLTNTSEIATSVYLYNVTTSGQDLTLTAAGPASVDSLNYLNKLQTNRGFNLSLSTPTIYNIGSSLDEMGSGDFAVQGYDSNTANSILSGQLDRSSEKGSFFKIVNDNTIFTINDITVISAEKDGDGSVLALDNESSSATVTNVFIRNNSASGDGGAVSQSAGTLSISNSTFYDNSAGGSGGALSANSAAISNSTFTDNTASINGGAINVKAGNAINIYGATNFDSNSSSVYGGAIYNSGDLILNSNSGNIVFSNNTDSTGMNDIYNNGGNIYIPGTSGDVTINSGISGTGTINNINTGTFYLGGNNQNYTGDFFQNNGTMYVNPSSTFFGGESVYTGGTLNWLSDLSSAKPSNGVLQMQGGNLNIGSNTMTNAVLNLNNPSDTILPAANVYVYTGSTLDNSGTVTLNQGDAWYGNINNTGNLILDDFSHATGVSSGMYSQSGANSNLVLQNNASFMLSGGTSTTPIDINEGNILIGNGTTGSSLYVYENNSISSGANVQLGQNNNLEIGSLYTDSTTPYMGGSVTFNSGDTLVGKVDLNEGDLIFDGFNFNQNSGQLVQNGGTFNIENGSNVTFGNNVQINKGQDADITVNPPIPAIPSEIIVSSNSNLNLNSSSSQINADYLTLNSTGNLNIGQGFSLNLPSTTTIDGGTLNTMNGEIGIATINNLVIGNNNANFSLDLDPNGASDTFNFGTVTTAGATGEINISNFNFTQVPLVDEIQYQIFNPPSAFPANVTFNDTAIGITPIMNYKLYSQGNGAYLAKSVGFNPQVFRGQAATLAMYNNQLTVNNILFDHVYLVSEELLAQENPNRYAAILPQFAPYQYSREDGGLWFKSYVTLETLTMTQGLDVSNNVYGTLVGADFPVINLKKGWQFLPTTYIGYNGGNQTFSGVNMAQNGGQAGFMGTIFKDDFLSSILAYGGGYGNEMSLANVKDTTGDWFAGVAAKTAYNFHPTKNLIIQPTAMVSYNIFGEQNWNSNYGALSMNSGLLNGINVAPGLNVIYGGKNWSAYGTIQYMFNINDNVGGNASTINLPSVSMRHGYLEYGVGVTKTSKNNRLSGYSQITIRNGGRTGIGFQLGLSYKI